jgi:hypothetical protein
MPEGQGQLVIGDLGKLNLMYAYGLRNLNLIDQTVPATSMLLQYFKGPNYNRDEEYLEFFTREANPGIINAPINATIQTPTKGSYHAKREKIFWDMYWWSLDDEVKEKSIPRVMDMEANDSVTFYENVTDYKIIKELVAGASPNTTFAAQSGVWDSAGHVEQDIIKGLQDLAYQSGIPHAKAKNIIVVFPTKVFTSFKGLDFIHNVNQSVETYFGNAYKNMVFLDFTPSLDSKGSRVIDIATGLSSDALTTNALIIYGGPQTLDVGEYIPKNIPRVETGSLGIFKGGMTATRRCFGAKTVGRFGADTSPYICKITGVTA